MKRPTKKPQLEKSKTVEELPAACADETVARAFLEANRWGDTPCCPRCGDTDVYRMTGDTATKRGLWRCRGCKKQYTVQVGTIFEDSAIPLHKWVRAFWEATKAKNGVSALELSRTLQITYKSALFMMHRIRHAMADGPDGGKKLGGVIEADETYWGGKPRVRSKKKGRNPNYPKTPVFAVVQRQGSVRASVMPRVTSDNIREALIEAAERDSTLMTDDLYAYRKVGSPFAAHDRINHSGGEYVRSGGPGKPVVHTNTVEGFFSRLKRKLHGTHHAVSKEHLFRYVDEAAFIYNHREINDGERVLTLIRQTDGKRLMYRHPVQRAG